jgi:GxxExxY protein
MHLYEPGPVLTNRIIGLAIKVHRKLGPGLLEAVYNLCLCWELEYAGLEFERELPPPSSTKTPA